MLALHRLNRNARVCTRRSWLPARALGCFVAMCALLAMAQNVQAQSPINNGWNHSGTISTPGEVDQWTFTAAQNDSIVLSIGEVGANPEFWPWIRLVGPTGTLISSASGPLVAYISATATLSGTYTVTVASNDSGHDATGGYLLTLAKIPGAFAVPSDDQGGAMVNGVNHQGHIHRGDLDQWSFTAAQNDSIVVSIGEVLDDEVDPGFWPWIRVFGPNGALLYSISGPWVAYAPVTAPLSGTYTVVVATNDSGHDAEGDYQLTFARIPGTFVVPTGDQGGTMVNGANHQGHIHRGDLDQWSFTAAQNDSIVVSIGEVLDDEVDPGFWPWIRVFGPNGALLYSISGDWVAYAAVTAPLSGTYTVLVATNDSGHDAEGDYQLTLAKVPGTFVVPAGDQGGTMVNGANHQGRIHRGDLDQWSFTAAQNDSILVSIGEILDSEIDPGFWPWIRVFGPNGALLYSISGNWVAYAAVTAPLTGTYTVLVATNDSGHDAEGDYQLTLAKIPGTFTVPTGDEGGPMTNGVNHPGRIHRGDLDQWTFFSSLNSLVTVSISEVVATPDTGFWPWIRVFGPDGALVRSISGDVSTQTSFTAPQTGIYRVVVATNDSGHDGTGRYLLQATGITSPPVLTERIAVGLGSKPGDGGWYAMRNDRSASFSHATFGRVPWGAYNATGGGVRVAAGDVDGDGLDELVVGLDRGSAGWFVVLDDAAHGHAVLRWLQVQWTAYNTANGEVWPAVGDLDGDGRAEIVAGLGAAGYGWFEVFDDAIGGFAHVAWRQVAWPTYTGRATSVVHPAIGNVDGVGASEIILGLGVGSSGWIEVVNGAAGSYNHRSWLQVAWPAYNAANGTTFPAAGDVDGDGRAEIVTGLGSGGGGWIEVFEDATGSYAPVSWLRASWPAYNANPGETHPAVGNVDGDVPAEIVIGLAPFAGQGGWFEIFDNKSAGFVSLGWRNVEGAFKAAGTATYPAIGRFR
jgi:hypothetical protein